MELGEFVAQTLVEIARGAVRAQAEVAKLGGFVNPATFVDQKPESHFGRVAETDAPVFLADFDVAVTVLESSGTNADAKLQIASLLKLGAGGNTTESQQTVSRIKFRVPFALPIDAKSKQLMDGVLERQRRQIDSAYDGFRR